SDPEKAKLEPNRVPRPLRSMTSALTMAAAANSIAPPIQMATRATAPMVLQAHSIACKGADPRAERAHSPGCNRQLALAVRLYFLPTSSFHLPAHASPQRLAQRASTTSFSAFSRALRSASDGLTSFSLPGAPTEQLPEPVLQATPSSVSSSITFQDLSSWAFICLVRNSCVSLESLFHTLWFTTQMPMV